MTNSGQLFKSFATYFVLNVFRTFIKSWQLRQQFNVVMYKCDENCTVLKNEKVFAFFFTP